MLFKEDINGFVLWSSYTKLGIASKPYIVSVVACVSVLNYKRNEDNHFTL